MIDITIDVRENRWKKQVRTYRKTVHEACLAALAHQKVKRGALAVVLADDAFIRDLNHAYRGKNKPTNVLSFEGEGDSLGDIVLAFETISREAALQDKSLRHHLMHLLVHGTLHLLDFNHERKEEAAIMERIEIKILEKLGVGNPYL